MAAERNVPDTGPFAVRLRSFRKAAGLTQEEVAARAGITSNAVSSLERGTRTRPYPHTVRALADALRLSDPDRQQLIAAATGRNPAMSPSPAPPRSGYHATTPLIGREQEVADLVAMLIRDDVRLVTLTGPGGVGKTRLASEAARRVEATFADGVAFVSLVAVSDPALVLSVIGSSFSAPGDRGAAAGTGVGDRLRDRSMLLVLDNFEHLMDAAPELTELLGDCPSITLLVTSRARLRLRGETEFAVPPLALPSTTRNPAPTDVERSPAGHFFLDRARAAKPTFTVTADNAATVAAICWRLGGLPLALELAASKVGALPPHVLLDRLDTALSAGWARDLPTRQHTLRATLDWSYELLDPGAQALLRLLSVFSGGFSLEAAETVAHDTSPTEEVLPMLEQLVEHSLVTLVEGSDGQARYTMLEPIRQYAESLLVAEGRDGPVRRQHAHYFLSLAERAYAEQRGLEHVQWLDRTQWEKDNLRAAIASSLTAGEGETAARLGWALWLSWWMEGHLVEGRRWMEATLQLSTTSHARTRALLVHACMAYAQGDLPAASRSWNEALEVSRASDDIAGQAYALAGTGLVTMTSDPAAAEDRLRHAIRLATGVGDEWLTGLTTIWLGTLLLVSGDVQAAQPMFELALASARARNDRLVAYVALFNLAQLALSVNDPQAAHGALLESIELSEQTRDRANLAYALDLLAVVHGRRQQFRLAAVLMGAASHMRHTAAGPVYSFYLPDESLQAETYDEVRAALGSAELDAAMRHGRSMDLEANVSFALSTNGDEELKPRSD